MPVAPTAANDGCMWAGSKESLHAAVRTATARSNVSLFINERLKGFAMPPGQASFEPDSTTSRYGPICAMRSAKCGVRAAGQELSSCVAYLLATLAAVFYGAADFTGGMVTRRVATIPVVLLSQATGLVMVAVTLPFLATVAPRTADLWWGAVGGLAGGVGVGLLYYGLAIGTMSVVAPTTAVLAVAIPVIASIGLGERPGWLAVTGILVGIGAIALVSRPTISSQTPPRPSGIGVALASGVAIGLFLLALAQTRPPSGLC